MRVIVTSNKKKLLHEVMPSLDEMTVAVLFIVNTSQDTSGEPLVSYILSLKE